MWITQILREIPLKNGQYVGVEFVACQGELMQEGALTSFRPILSMFTHSN